MDESILERLVQIGTVTAVNTSKKQARVKFQDKDMISGWLTVLQRPGTNLNIKPDGEHTHTITDTYSGGGSASTEPDHNHEGSVTTSYMPKVNDTVLVLYLPVSNSDGFILGGLP